MLTFYVHFRDCPPLCCRIHDTKVGQRYYTLVKHQYQQDPCAVFRDQQKYTVTYFAKLAEQAHEVLGWDWQRPVYDLAITTQLHKDIEQYLAQGYENIPAKHDHLLHEIHFALHAIESGSRRSSWLQIEWFNDLGFKITADQYPAKLNLEFGDLRLQNPYVGHHPLFVYQQQDQTNVSQTCRFHDFVKPGINLVIEKNAPQPFDWTAYLNWFQKYAPNIDQDQLRKFTGHPVVGYIENLEDLETVVNTPVLEFDRLSF